MSNKVLIEEDTDIGTSLGNPHKTILFNDDYHSMAEVVNQITKAIHCGLEQAMGIMMQAHATGSAVVIIASLERCEHVAAVLEEIGLVTSVVPV